MGDWLYLCMESSLEKVGQSRGLTEACGSQPVQSQICLLFGACGETALGNYISLHYKAEEQSNRL